VAVKTVQFRMEPDEYKTLEAQWKRAGFASLQEAGIHAFRVAFAARADANVPGHYLLQQQAFDEVLASGDEDLIGLVVKPLEFAQKRLRQRPGERGKAGG
jgi:hypothetical protein